MDISTLRTFVEVVNHGSFASVARDREVTPSSISRAVSSLEDELGVRLFQRNTRRLELTEAGRKYFERVSPLLDELELAGQIAIDSSEEPKGTLRITASAVYGELTIVPLLPEFAQLYPQLSVELLLTDTYLDLVEERIDVAIRLGTLQDSSYIARRLRSLSFYICASPSYLDKYGTPEEPNDLALHECLLFPRAGYNLNWLFKDSDDRQIDVPIKGRYMITHSRAIKRCALAGMGLALLPDWLVSEELYAGTLKRVFTRYTVTATDYDSAVWLLYPSREYLPLKTRVFVEFITGKIK